MAGIHAAPSRRTPAPPRLPHRPPGRRSRHGRPPGPCRHRGTIRKRAGRAPLGGRRNQPHSVRRVHRPGPARPRARALLLPRALVLRRPRGRDPGARRLQAHRGGRALGADDPRRGRWHQRGGERLRPPRHAVLPRAPGQPPRAGVPLSPVDLRPGRRAARRAHAPWREARGPRGRRHAAGLRPGAARPHPAEGGQPRRRGVRELRPGRGALRGVPRHRDPRLVRPPVQRAAAGGAPTTRRGCGPTPADATPP